MLDTPVRYGSVTRFLHWGMAILFAWQFSSALLRVFAEDISIEKFFWSTHPSTGTLILILAVTRGAWGWSASAGGPTPAMAFWACSRREAISRSIC